MCSHLRDYKVEQSDCSQFLPFICEKDPFIQPKMNWLPIIITLVFASLVIFFVIIPTLIFCCIKSSQRKDEKEDRKHKSLHASRQSLNSLSGSRHYLDETSKSYRSEEPRKKRPLLDGTASYRNDDASSDLIIKTDYRDDFSYLSDTTDQTSFKFSMSRPHVLPHVENEIQLLDQAYNERSRPTDNMTGEAKPYFSSFSSEPPSYPKPKPRTSKQSNPSDSETFTSNDEVTIAGGSSTKKKRARPKLKPLEEGNM
ncbi:hypothetical protein HELRODRAFT_193398 [Helobdella robusta]|uniref:Uncharacterized protein n=1 Tax=Helobdella robusta TaxID=6412 RepID=T1FUY3_HELRO|nr:hypothetical protein HELRODRAFT_193398 [Helobdella robusta]ESN96926.1 hypothetical protein HELRODRAFT_193398 [Helobdella robusta]